jgi:ribokinase
VVYFFHYRKWNLREGQYLMAGRIPTIVVVGPAYVDMAVKCQAVPLPGQVVEGSGFSCMPAGAGVNRAIQAANCGCEVSLIARVGDDSFGRMIQKNLQQYHIHTDLVYSANAMSTGIIVTLVDPQGKNSVCVCAGVNRGFGRNEIEYAAAEQTIGGCDACLVCGELPQEAVVAAIRSAQIHKRKVILDVCLPVHTQEAMHQIQWPMEYYYVDVLIVRFAEFTCASELGSGGMADLKFIGTELVARGASCVVMSLGWRGALIIDRQGGARHIPGAALEVVDNSGAVDAFCGALVACCGTKDSADGAVKFAVAAEALARSRFGTQESLPKKEDIIALLQQQPD